LVSVNRVGAVKQRLFVRNLKEIPLPRPPLRCQREMLDRWEKANREAADARDRAGKLLHQAEAVVVAQLSCPSECLQPKDEAEFTIRWSDTERWDFTFFRSDFRALQNWLEGQGARTLADVGEFRRDGWVPSDFPEGEFPYIEIGSVDPVHGIVSAEPVAVAEAPSRARYRVRAKDILIATTRPYLRKITEVPSWLDGAVCSSGFAVLSGVRPWIVREYLLAVLRSTIVIRQFERRMSGGSYPAISQDQLERVLVPIPDASIQAHIAERVGEFWMKASNELARADKLVCEALQPFEELFC